MIVSDILLRNADYSEVSLLNFPLYITSMLGLGTTIQSSTTELYNRDGSKLDSEKIGNRTITLTIKNFDKLHTAHSDWIYKYFKIKTNLSLVIVGTNDDEENVIRRIDCRVSKIEPSEFTKDDEYKIQLLCIDPYFHNDYVEEVKNLYSDSLFEFPFENYIDEYFETGSLRESHISRLVNNGNEAIGLEIRAIAKASFSGFIVTNLNTGEYVKCSEELNINSGETLVFNTNIGSRGISLIKTDGSIVNELYYMDINSIWFSLEVGITNIKFEVISGDPDLVDVIYIYDAKYGGL